MLSIGRCVHEKTAETPRDLRRFFVLTNLQFHGNIQRDLLVQDNRWDFGLKYCIVQCGQVNSDQGFQFR